jgi:hypothetical protein
MSLLFQKLTNSILRHYSEIESDVIRRLKESGKEIKVEGMTTYIEGHDQVDVLSVSLTDENGVLLHRYLKEYAGRELYCKGPKRLTPEREKYYERKRKMEEYIGENRERIEKMRGKLF